VERARRSRSPRTVAGQAVVEFALVSGIFLFTVFGLVEGGRLIYGYVALAYGVQEGGRYAALISDPRKTDSEVKARVAERAHLITVTVPLVEAKKPDGSARAFSARESGDRVRVGGTYTFTPVVSWVFGGDTSLTLEYATEFTVE
jgi:Flp pilus assembly protein TadG